MKPKAELFPRCSFQGESFQAPYCPPMALHQKAGWKCPQESLDSIDAKENEERSISSSVRQKMSDDSSEFSFNSIAGSFSESMKDHKAIDNFSAAKKKFRRKF